MSILPPNASVKSTTRRLCFGIQCAYCAPAAGYLNRRAAAKGKATHALVAMIVFLTVLAGSAVRAESPAELKPFEFLIGEWPASGTGQPGEGSGSATFQHSVQDQVILRTSYAEYPEKAGKPKSRHDDLMVIYAVPGVGARADYFDSEGHCIRYAVHSPAPGEAVFTSEVSGDEPRFRLSYRLEATGLLKGEFAIAPPGAPQAFEPYLTWEARKAAKRTQ